MVPRRCVRSMLAVVLLASVLSANTSVASSASNWGSNFVGQQTTRISPAGHPYWGWWGVSGFIHWIDRPALWPEQPDAWAPYPHVNSFVSIRQATSLDNWASGGLTMDKYTGMQNAMTWVERKQNGSTYFRRHDVVAIPGTCSVVVRAGPQTPSGWYDYRVWINNTLRLQTALPHQTGMASAYSESYNTGAYNRLANTRFGSNRSTFFNHAHALHLRNSSGQNELWDTSLTAGTTTRRDEWDPPYAYSPHSSYNHYYFGTYSRWHTVP